MASAPSRKNWRGMLIAIFVICVILGLIITAVIFMTPPDDGPHVRGRNHLDIHIFPQQMTEILYCNVNKERDSHLMTFWRVDSSQCVSTGLGYPTKNS